MQTTRDRSLRVQVRMEFLFSFKTSDEKVSSSLSPRPFALVSLSLVAMQLISFVFFQDSGLQPFDDGTTRAINNIRQV